MLDSDISVGIPRDVVGKRKLTPQEYDQYKAEAGTLALEVELRTVLRSLETA